MNFLICYRAGWIKPKKKWQPRLYVMHAIRKTTEDKKPEFVQYAGTSEAAASNLFDRDRDFIASLNKKELAHG